MPLDEFSESAFPFQSKSKVGVATSQGRGQQSMSGDGYDPMNSRAELEVLKRETPTGKQMGRCRN